MPETFLEPGATTLPEEFTAGLCQRLDGEKIELPLLPEVVWEIMDLSASDGVDARRLANLIHRDQALAGNVLRVVNSPLYMPLMPVVSLQQAISLLGTTQLCELSFAVALQSRIFDVPGYRREIRGLWDHAVGTAVYAREITHVRHHKLEGIFLCGLLHDIGKPVILQILVDLQNELGCMLEPTIVTAIMEAHHTTVGNHLAERWALPIQVRQSIAHHHEDPPIPGLSQVVLVTSLANYLAHYAVLPDVFHEEGLHSHPALPELRLRPDELKALLHKRNMVLMAVEAMRNLA